MSGQQSDYSSEYKPRWLVYNEILVYDGQQISGSTKIAAFDMDLTIIDNKSRGTTRKFPKGRHDWVWLHDNVPKVLKDLYTQGYKIVIFTNQAGIARGNTKQEDIMGKISDLIAEVGIPIQAYVSTTKDAWRKPSKNMWEYMSTYRNQGIKVEAKNSFYVGDAAGRPWGWKRGKKKDFSNSDREFAANSGVAFFTPEEFFLGEARYIG
jgi:bifunctional polynucleotide phosphatase/kinase